MKIEPSNTPYAPLSNYEQVSTAGGCHFWHYPVKCVSTNHRV